MAPASTVRSSARQGADDVSTADHARQADRVAGFLCAFSLALSGIAMVRSPGLLATTAVVVALVAVVMTRAHRTLAAVSVAVGAAAFFVGMVVAVLTDSGLY
jgi:predicted membrane protein